MMSNQLSIFYQTMSQLADQLQFLNAQNEQQVRELQMSIDHSLEQHSTQSQQQLRQLLASSTLTFRLESLPASQLVSAQVSVAATPQLQRSSHPSPSPQPSNRLEPEPPRYRMCR